MARIDVGLTAYADSAFNRASFPLRRSNIWRLDSLW